MIKSVTVTNHLNESVTMELRFPEKSGFLIRGIDGLGPAKADINTSEVGSMDGGLFNSARIGRRNIVFSLVFLPSPTIEDARQKSYRYFPLKKRIKILVETDNRTSEIYGYVESNDPNIFSRQEGTTISVICPDPYFYSPTPTVTQFSSSTPLFEFPFSNESLTENLIEFGRVQLYVSKNIVYRGDASIGMKISIHVLADVPYWENLTIASSSGQMIISIGRFAALVGSGMLKGDVITISTIRGKKSAYLLRNGAYINIFNAIVRNSNWFQLQQGDNVILCLGTNGAYQNIEYIIENQIAYGGI